MYELSNQNKFGELLKWANSPSIFLKNIIKLKFLPENFSQERSPISRNTKNKYDSNILIKHLKENYFKSLLPHFGLKEIWEINKNISLKQSIIKRITSEWIIVRMEEESKFASHENSQIIYL